MARDANVDFALEPVDLGEIFVQDFKCVCFISKDLSLMRELFLNKKVVWYQEYPIISVKFV